MNAKHTPGPWELVSRGWDGQFIYGSDDRAPSNRKSGRGCSMSTQPTAMRLADALEADPSDITGHKAAAELRQLHDLLGKANALARIRCERIKELETESDALRDALRLALPILQEVSDGEYASTQAHRALIAAQNALAKVGGAA